MRRLLPQPKDRRKVPIPPDLRESLRQVHDLIEQAKHDPDIELGFDDAIQVGAVCGGKFGKKRRAFHLTYFPEDEGERGRWYLTFHPTEIEDIGIGRMTEIMMYCCTTDTCRCKFREADDWCFDCDYAADPNFGTFGFPEAEQRLRERGVSSLSATSSREDVIARLGPPDDQGGGVNDPPFGFIWPWIRYRRPDCQIRFEFNRASTRIRNITILERDWEPGM